jgi:membrane-bound ClpP family serine protease
VEVDVHRLAGTEGTVRRAGYVLVGGELWRARRADGGTLRPGERVRVDVVEDGLQIVVSPVAADPGEPARSPLPPPSPPRERHAS